jgi:Ca2+-binding EF-hand superfamily protein
MGAFVSVDLRPEEVRDLEDASACESRGRQLRRGGVGGGCVAAHAATAWGGAAPPRPPPPPPSAVAPKEIKSLYRRFQRLDRSGRGTLSTDDLTMIPELSMNPLAARLLSSKGGLFERDGEDRVNFRSFVTGLSVFAPRARPEVRQRVVFRLFDVDGDGFIGPADLRAVLALMCGKVSVSAAAVETIVARTLASCDGDGDGRISFADFCGSSATGGVAWDGFTVAVSGFHRWEQTLSQGGGSGGGAASSSGGGVVKSPSVVGKMGGSH